MSKIRITHCLFGAAALLIIGSGVYLFQNDDPVQTDAVKLAPAVEQVVAAGSQRPAEGAQNTEEVYMFANPDNFSSNPPREAWEEEILKIAKGPGDDVSKIEILLNRIPHLNDEGKLLAMEHAVNLIPDHLYTHYRARLFSLAQNDELRDAMMVDVLSRDDKLRFQTLVEALRQPPSKAQEEAKEILEAYLDRNPGNDPNAWQQAVEKMLAENEE